MLYDHHRKAGNQGDCVKHPALIAAMTNVLQTNESMLFTYLDVFAGHAWHPLLDEDELSGVQKALEWKLGIGALHKHLWEAPELNEPVRLWRNWYLPDRPSLVRGWYPGSSVIATDMCRKYKRSIHMTVFDISEEAQTDLRRCFQAVHPTGLTKNDLCVIGRSLNPTELEEDALRELNFVFIDPPRFAGEGGLPDWRPYFQHILLPRAKSPTLMWLPASGADQDWNKLDSYCQVPDQSPITNQRNPGFFHQLAECLYVGYHWSAVRWARGGSNAACILIYNCAQDVIRAALDCIVGIAGNGWEKRDSTG